MAGRNRGRWTKTLAVVAGLAALASCGRIADSRFNPLNWSAARPAATLAPEGGYPDEIAADPRPLVDTITALDVDRNPGGIILRATGLPARQAFWNGALLPVTDGPVGGVLSYRFVAVPPPVDTRVSTPRSREIEVGVFLDRAALAGVTEIRVSAARNALAVRR